MRNRPTTNNDAADPGALRRRERGAWDAVYSRHVSAVYRCVAALMPRDRHLVEEVHQQVWLAAIESIEGFDPGKGTFRGWICGIAHRQVARHYRRQHAQSAVATDEVSWLADEALLPPDVAERVEAGAQVRAAVAALPDESQAVLLAKYVEGLSVSEIADRRGKSTKAVESLLSRTRQRLRKLLRTYVSSSHATLQGRTQ
jgi:RNA polymerase sigma-70 factor (ECF subfamily)